MPRRQEKQNENKETRQHLLECAKKEFLEKGYMKASLRNICKEAGVTTGALYFFFKDKDDLFCNVVGHMMDRLNAVLTEHFSVEVDEMNNGMASDHNEDSDFESARNIVHEIYMHREEVLLVLTKSQGSSMESMPDNIVDQMDAHNAFICEAMCRAYGTPMVDRNVVHWMSHSQIDMFIFMVTHIDNEKDALKFVETGMKYLISGWYGLVKPWQDPE